MEAAGLNNAMYNQTGVDFNDMHLQYIYFV